ncbi:thermonuclease family protein [uncultured Draconibacterium sp.]|uniref:thermonuclease family protein n=1 Tax=uncultured Draconibacterium sp. TaxID=1573823 RepID=UPI003216A3AA
MYKYKAKIDRIVDGDTMDIIVDLGFKISTHQRIRLQGINTPETYNVKKDSEEYRKGSLAKEFVIQRIEANNYEALIDTEKDTGKYGRYIATVWLADSPVSLNQELVDKGYAVVANY